MLFTFCIVCATMYLVKIGFERKDCNISPLFLGIFPRFPCENTRYMCIFQLLFMHFSQTPNTPSGPVGKPAGKIAELAGFSVPAGTKVLVAREEEAGPTHPYSSEKLCPVLAFFVMESETAVLRRVTEVLRHEGAGHTFAIHCEDRNVIERFATAVPVSRLLVNTPAALGGIGATTGLFPALTLGCGAVGGSASSNNIGPMDLVNIRRVAWGREMPDKPRNVSVNPELVELLAAKILERLK
jgi:hypothetical protein